MQESCTWKTGLGGLLRYNYGIHDPNTNERSTTLKIRAWGIPPSPPERGAGDPNSLEARRQEARMEHTSTRNSNSKSGLPIKNHCFNCILNTFQRMLKPSLVNIWTKKLN